MFHEPLIMKKYMRSIAREENDQESCKHFLERWPESPNFDWRTDSSRLYVCIDRLMDVTSDKYERKILDSRFDTLESPNELNYRNRNKKDSEFLDWFRNWNS